MSCSLERNWQRYVKDPDTKYLLRFNPDTSPKSTEIERLTYDFYDLKRMLHIRLLLSDEIEKINLPIQINLSNWENDKRIKEIVAVRRIKRINNNTLKFINHRKHLYILEKFGIGGF